MKLRNFSILLVATAAISLLLGCSKNTAQAAGPGGPGGQRPPAPVIVATVDQRDVPVQITAIGNVEAYQTVQIRAQVNGQIERVYFKEGDDVRQGQMLFQLDKAPFQAALEQAEANLQRDQANAVNAQAQAGRYTALETQGVISREQAEQMRTQAQANASAVNADKAAVDAARVQLRYTDIKSPIDARAGALLINVGNLIKARLRGEKRPEPFRYRDYGNLATIGRKAAVADFGWIRVRGFVAWLIWSFAHIFFLIGFRNRIVVALNWLWAYFTFQRGARLITGQFK